MSFIPLHVNSTYTFLSSALPLDKLINHAIKNKLSSIALTDFNSLTGEVSFYNKCESNHIKPIIGLDLTIEDNLFTFLVSNETGYKNLLKLSSLYNLGKLNFKNAKGLTDGLITIISSKQSKLLERRDQLGDMRFAYYLKNIEDTFGKLYIGLEIYNLKDQVDIKDLRKYLLDRNYSLLAFPFIRYLNKEDEIVYRIAQAIKNDTHLEEKDIKAEGEYYFYNNTELDALYEKEEIDNTSKIANLINFNLIKKRGKLIKFCDNPDELLKEKTYKLLSQKLTITDEYKQRLDYELDVIKKMGYSDYFLIVSDYVKFAKDNNIFVGPGRGSAGGSLVAYSLDIITIDPIKADLLFERFLNEGRKTMPDIDVDFEDTRREEVVNYLKDKYGKNKVGTIATSQTIKAKQAIRDIGRVYQIRDSYINTLCKTLWDEDDLHNAYKTLPTFKRLIDSDKYYLFIVKLASKIEGFPRQVGTHAAGIIINDEPLEESLPVYIDINNNYSSQLEKDDLETLGYLKMDLLGLRNLTIVKNVVENLDNVNYQNLPYEDKDAIKLIALGQTLGLFQLDKPKTIKIIKRFKPTTFEDIALINAFIRPGPNTFVDNYIKRKEGKEKVIYPHRKLVEILRPTLGIIVYQEQIMQIVRVMANYTYSQADSFRRAISKKDANKLNQLKVDFIDASIKNGNNKVDSEKIFNLIYKFANYGFNKSHAYAYAKLATQMAYLKVKYPDKFYCAVLDNGANFSAVIAEIRSHNISLKLPDINKADKKYISVNNEIIIPLTQIKGIQNQAVNNILKDRKENGEYTSFINFVIRATKEKITASTITKLIDSGCFDSFKNNRASLREALDRVIDFAKLSINQGNQLNLDDSLIPLPRIKNIDDDEIYNINQEQLNLGLTLSKSPLDLYKDLIKKDNLSLISEIREKRPRKIIGMIKSIRRIKTKKDGKVMAFVTLSDNVVDINITVFNDIYIKYEQILQSAKIIIVVGRYEESRDEFVASEIKSV